MSLALEVIGLSRRFGTVKALDDVSVQAAEGEFLTILGQSGSGKTTLLRVISGLDKPTSVTRLAIGGKDVNGSPPYERNVTTVFQHYGLFPHMTVGENVEYGLKIRGMDTAARAREAQSMLQTVRLPDKYDRRINQLSGGERQRVALARSLVLRPDILLLDEPLGSLDERLRMDMQIELVQLQRRFGTTFVFITHSQEEALTMSDRIVLMRQGRIVQDGPPEALFDRPNSAFTGTFMGVENQFAGRVQDRESGKITVVRDGVTLRGHWSGSGTPSLGEQVAVMVRAERIMFAPNSHEALDNTLQIIPQTRVYRGKYIDVIADSALGPVTVRALDTPFTPGVAADVTWSAAHTNVAPLDS